MAAVEVFPHCCRHHLVMYPLIDCIPLPLLASLKIEKSPATSVLNYELQR